MVSSSNASIRFFTDQNCLMVPAIMRKHFSFLFYHYWSYFFIFKPSCSFHGSKVLKITGSQDFTKLEEVYSTIYCCKN